MLPDALWRIVSATPGVKQRGAISMILIDMTLQRDDNTSQPHTVTIIRIQGEMRDTYFSVIDSFLKYSGFVIPSADLEQIDPLLLQDNSHLKNFTNSVIEYTHLTYTRKE